MGTSGSKMLPFVIKIENGNINGWSKVFANNIELDYVQHVKFSKDYSQIALIFDSTNSHKFYLVLLRATDGYILKSYQYSGT